MKLKRVGFLVPTLNTAKVRPLNRDTVPRTAGRALQERNARLMRRNPFCSECLKKGLQILTAEFDHITPLADGGSDEDENIQGLCLACHREKSAQEQATRYGCDPIK
jgi:5-methylcytosine-specific restriction endonuclease McrA